MPAVMRAILKSRIPEMAFIARGLDPALSKLSDEAAAEQAPELVAVLEKVNLPIDLLNQNLARMTKEHIDSPKLARIFFKEHPEIWHTWVSEAAAKKIDATL